MDMALKTLLEEVVAKLEPLSLSRVVLFGSHAQGHAVPDSDLDLLVVLDREDVPQTYQQRVSLDLCVLRLLRDIRRSYAMDIVVYTKAMYHRFLASNSAFAREIQEKGLTVYEAGSTRMA